MIKIHTTWYMTCTQDVFKHSRHPQMAAADGMEASDVRPRGEDIQLVHTSVHFGSNCHHLGTCWVRVAVWVALDLARSAPSNRLILHPVSDPLRTGYGVLVSGPGR